MDRTGPLCGKEPAMKWQSVLPALVLASLAGTAMAQTTATPAVQPATPAAPTVSAAPVIRTSGVPQRDTLMRMTRPITIDVKDQSLESVMQFIQSVTQADM